MESRSLLDLACLIVRTPSVTTDGTRALAELLREKLLDDDDLDVRIDGGPTEAHVNLVATKGLDGLPPLLLNSHLDTVPPGDPALWTRCGGDPFRPTIDGIRLYGLGSADAKLDWLCKALALARFRGRRFRRGVIFVGTYGEESGLRGARALLDALPRRPAAAWAGEPTSLELVVRHKGLLVVAFEARSPDLPASAASPTTRLVVGGRAAHSSTPHLGENAIFRALDLARRHRLEIASLHGGDAANKVPARCELEILGEPPPESLLGNAAPTVAGRGRGRGLPKPLQNLLLEAVSEVRALGADSAFVDQGFTPPVLTASMGRLEAAEGSARFVLDVRTLPGDRSARILNRLEEFARSRSDASLSVSLQVERDNPPLDTPAESEAVVWSLGALASLGLPTTLRTKAGCTEAGLYASAGIASVVFGAGVSQGNVHAPNEFVPIPELERSVEFYSQLLQEVCLE